MQGGQTQRTEPWEEAQPYLREVMSGAQGLYGGGGAQLEYYPGQTVADPNYYTNQAVGRSNVFSTMGNADLARANENLQKVNQGQGIQGELNRFYRGGTGATTDQGFLGQFQQGQATPANVALGEAMSPAQVNNSYLDGVGGQTAGAAGYYDDVLSGSYFGRNPELDGVFNRAADQIENRVGSAAMLSGRTGSGASQAMLQRGLGDLAQDIYYRDYDAERARMGQAAAGQQGLGGLALNQANTYGNLYNAEANRNLSAAQLAGNLNAQNLTAQQVGNAQTNQDRNFQFQAASGLGGQLDRELASGQQLQADMMERINAGYQAGDVRNQYNQALVDEDFNRFMFNQQAPREALEWYDSIIRGYGGLGGYSSGSQSAGLGQKVIGGITAASGFFGG